MIIPYTALFGTLGILMASLVVLMIRKDLLYKRYATLWLFLSLLVTVLGLFPGITDIVGRWFGVAYPPIFAVVLAIVFTLVKQVLADIDRSQQEIKIRRLAQRIAMLEGRIEEVAEKPLPNDD